MGVDFHHHPIVGGGFEDFLVIHIRPRPFEQQPPRRMADGRNVRAFDRRQKPLRDLVAGLLEAVVQHRQDPVGLFEDIVRQIHRGIFEDVAFDALQDFDAFDVLR